MAPIQVGLITYVIVVIITIALAIGAAIAGLVLHAGAFALGCIFMFLVSTVRYNGQSLIGGRD